MSMHASDTRPMDLLPLNTEILSRQCTHDSLGGTTPLLVYGKAVTPIRGSWADEPLSPAKGPLDLLRAPLNLTDHVIHDEGSSTARSSNSDVPQPNRHVSSIFRHDPYSVGTRQLYRCECPQCTMRSSETLQQPTAVIPPSPPAYVNEFEYHHLNAEAPPYIPKSAWPDVVQEELPPTASCHGSSFVPPPPPPLVTRDVIAETSNTAAAVYHSMVLRWYHRITAVQDRWVHPSDVCPEPDETKYSLAEWVDDVSQWWHRSFARTHVLLPSEDHQTSRVLEPRAKRTPRIPLPRGQRGTFGLSAEHNNRVARHPQSSRQQRVSHQ